MLKTLIPKILNAGFISAMRTGMKPNLPLKFSKPSKCGWFNPENTRISLQGKKIGFDIDNRWMAANDSVPIKVTYFDKHAGELNLVYQNGTGQVVKKQELNGDQELKTVSFFVSGIQSVGIGQHFDFTLEAGENTQNIVVSFVRVIK